MTNSKKAQLLHASPDPFIQWVKDSKEKEFSFYGTDSNPFFSFANEMGIGVVQAGPGAWVCGEKPEKFNEWAALVTDRVRKEFGKTVTKKQLLAITRTTWEELQELKDSSEVRETVETALEALELSA